MLLGDTDIENPIRVSGCERCETDLPGDAAFCPMCGTRRIEPAEGPGVQTPSPSPTLVGGRYEVPQLTPDTPAGTLLLGRALPAGGAVAVRVFPLERRDGGAAAREQCRRLKQTLDLLGAEPHPAIGIALDVVEDAGRVFIIDEPIERPTLRDALATGGPLGWAELGGWARQALDTLAYAHARGVFHGGPRAEHRVVGDEGVVRLGGFGESAIELVAKLDRAETYAPLERLGGRVPDATTDIYCLAVSLHELLIGAPPGHNHTGGIYVGDARPDLPPWVCDALHRALASDSRRRFATAASFRQALERPVSDAPAPTHGGAGESEDPAAAAQPPETRTATRPAPPFEPDTPLYGCEQPPSRAPGPTRAARPGSATGNRSLPAQSSCGSDAALAKLPEWVPEPMNAEAPAEYADRPMLSWTTARPTADVVVLAGSYTLIPAACLVVSWLMPWWTAGLLVAAVLAGWRAVGAALADNLRERRARLEGSALVGSRVRIHGWEHVPEPPPYHAAYECDFEAVRQPNWWIDLTVSPPPGAGAPFPFRRLRPAASAGWPCAESPSTMGVGFSSTTSA